MGASVLINKSWYKAHGKGHLTRMNAVLRAYVDAHKGRGKALVEICASTALDCA